MGEAQKSLLHRAWEAADSNWKITFSFIGAAGWFAIAVGLLIAWHNGTIALAALVGTALGWVAGILLAPYEEEARRFTVISKGISGIIGGYLLAKLDKVFELVTDSKSGTPLVLEAPFIRSVMMSLGCFLVAAIAVFVARTYWQGGTRKQD